MMYAASWTDLHNIVQWLRGRDESQWEEQTKLLSDTMVILSELSRPIPRLDSSPNPTSELYAFPALPADINDAMPYLRAMLSAMYWRSREDAIEYGEAALALLPEG
jgi:hypothetical protein